MIDRGAAELEELDLEPAVDLMIENTDDAYGFPPFRSLPWSPLRRARALREREREP